VETYALRIECGSSVLAYTADSAYCDALVEVAEGADVLLAEATLPQAYAGRVPHLTPREAATVAVEAGVGRLLLTHLWPTADADEILRDAREVLDDEVTLARELMEIELG
jgi:ribonuclease BN (tRNA processing enzyme)